MKNSICGAMTTHKMRSHYLCNFTISLNYDILKIVIPDRSINEQKNKYKIISSFQIRNQS